MESCQAGASKHDYHRHVGILPHGVQWAKAIWENSRVYDVMLLGPTSSARRRAVASTASTCLEPWVKFIPCFGGNDFKLWCGTQIIHECKLYGH